MSKILYFYMLLLIATVKANSYYSNYRLYQVFPDKDPLVSLLRSLDHVEFWEAYIVVNKTQKVMVAPRYVQQFEAELLNNHVKYKLLFKDVQKLINKQRKCNSNSEFNWRAYMSLGRINAWLETLLDLYPEVVSVVTIGKSTEYRDLKGIIINYNKERENNTEIGIIEGTIHAREWMSTAMVTWLINEFLTSKKPDIRKLAEDVEWHIFPVINPDGYTYSFEERRFWKKNRNKKYFQSCKEYGVDDDISNGVDLNKNFDIAWLAANSASVNPCSNNFGGSNPFSEQETLFLSEYVEWKTQDTSLLYYISFHEYSQMILIPYGHVFDGQTIDSTNFGVMYKAAKKSSEKIKNKFGVEYKVGLAPNILYPTSSSSIDYVKLTTDVPIAYQIGLRDYEQHGYLTPPEQIIPTCQQAMELLVEVHTNIESSATNHGHSTLRTAKKTTYLTNEIKSKF